jgi:hypothetical protein
MIPPVFDPPGADVDLDRDLFAREVPGALVILEATDSESLSVKHIGARPPPARPPPGAGRLGLPRAHRGQLGRPHRVVASSQRMHSFWLVDAVTQGRRIPSHVGLVLLYSPHPGDRASWASRSCSSRAATSADARAVRA